MNRTFLLLGGVFVILFFTSLYQLNAKKAEIQELKTAQAVANAQAVQQQAEIEFKWQQGLNDALDTSNIELKNVELNYSTAIADIDSVHDNTANDSNKQVPASSQSPCIVKSNNDGGRNSASFRACEKSVLNFAKERDECAVKYNTLLKLYRQLQEANNAN